MICITTTTENTALRTIFSSGTIIELEIPNFFTYFKDIRYITIESLTSVGDVPTFFKLVNVGLKGPKTHVFDENIVSGLTNLRYLDFSESYFNCLRPSNGDIADGSRPFLMEEAI